MSVIVTFFLTKIPCGSHIGLTFTAVVENDLEFPILPSARFIGVCYHTRSILVSFTNPLAQ